MKRITKKQAMKRRRTALATLVAVAMVTLSIVSTFKTSANEKVQTQKNIVASQIANDGTIQITYSDESSVTMQGVENNSGTKIIDLQDGSWIAINEAKNVYEFQPVEMGDYSYELDNLEQLNKCVNTYFDNKIGTEKIKLEEKTYRDENFHLEKGDLLFKYNNGSYAITNNLTGLYMFQPAEMVDYQLTFKTYEALENCIKTYIENKSK